MELKHSRTKGSKNGIRLYQNKDGTWTELGKERRRKGDGRKITVDANELRRRSDNELKLASHREKKLGNASRYLREKYEDDDDDRSNISGQMLEAEKEHRQAKDTLRQALQKNNDVNNFINYATQSRFSKKHYNKESVDRGRKYINEMLAMDEIGLLKVK